MGLLRERGRYPRHRSRAPLLPAFRIKDFHIALSRCEAFVSVPTTLTSFADPPKSKEFIFYLTVSIPANMSDTFQVVPDSLEAIPGIIAELNASFDSGKTLSIEWRKEQLRSLWKMIDVSIVDLFFSSTGNSKSRCSV
jgi:hypothetical protein